jgi:hypothetical protein
MPTTMTVINPEDTLDVGRQKINSNEADLMDQGNSLEAAQAAHVTAGHPTLNYTKSEVDNIEAVQDAALTTHKTSGDHDSRYLAASYLATLVRTTLDQAIGGIKTFANKIIVKMQSPSIELQHDDGYPFARFYANGDTGTLAEAGIAISNMGNFSSAIAIDGNGNVNSPNGDMKAKGKILATQDYVASSIAGSIGSATVQTMDIEGDTYANARSTTVNVIPPSVVRPNSTLTRLVFGIISGLGETLRLDVNLSVNFPSNLYPRFLKVDAAIDGSGYVTVRLYTSNESAQLAWTLSYESANQVNCPIVAAGDNYLSCYAEFLKA